VLAGLSVNGEAKNCEKCGSWEKEYLAIKNEKKRIKNCLLILNVLMR
jgi:hypothetical protein